MAAPGQTKKQSRKVGRNHAWLMGYAARHQREFNKARRMVRMLKKHPGDIQGSQRLQEIARVLSSRQRGELGIGV